MSGETNSKGFMDVEVFDCEQFDAIHLFGQNATFNLDPLRCDAVADACTLQPVIEVPDAKGKNDTHPLSDTVDDDWMS